MRLIDADELRELYNEHNFDTYNDYNFAIDTLDYMSTIDAKPVRHGKWTADEILYTQGMTACSCCKTEYYRDDLYMVGNNAQGELPNYCPNCGARMDEND